MWALRIKRHIHLRHRSSQPAYIRVYWGGTQRFFLPNPRPPAQSVLGPAHGIRSYRRCVMCVHFQLPLWQGGQAGRRATSGGSARRTVAALACRDVSTCLSECQPTSNIKGVMFPPDQSALSASSGLTTKSKLYPPIQPKKAAHTWTSTVLHLLPDRGGWAGEGVHILVSPGAQWSH